jgi:hypothetical protein
MTESSPFYNFQAHSRAFLARAQENVARFENEGELQFFFYAALEIRYGVEARLNEYLAPALKTIGKQLKDVPEYVASKLLKRLVAVDPTSEQQSTLRVTSEPSGNSSFVGVYTPVSRRLAAIHGQLGELLHYKFFVNNEHWMLRKSLGGNPHKTIPDFLELLKEGITELEQATSGRLLENPKFTELVQEVLAENGPND